MSLFLKCRKPKDFVFVTIMYYKIWKLNQAYRKLFSGVMND